jgi:RNA polymerase sigma-70 factor (ECF subfamily)
MSGPDGDPHTTQLQLWLARLRQGDAGARDELLRSVCGRLEVLARRMLRKFPRVQRWEQTSDVLNSALMRLLRALEQVEPESVRAFYGLAALQIRRELLDMLRRIRGPQGVGANHESGRLDPDRPSGDGELVDRAEDTAELERWAAFHEEVERLPAREREVVGLVFYHGWTQEEVAAEFGVDVRTVQRWWQSARLKLYDRMHEP